MQPDDTGLATTGDQAGDMGDNPVKKVTEGDTNTALPHLEPGRQVGWIFANGEAVAIERHECEDHPSEDAR